MKSNGPAPSSNDARTSGYPEVDPRTFTALQEEEGMSLADWVDVVMRGRWIILACLALIAIPVSIYAYLLPNQYRSTSLVLIQRNDRSLSNILPMAAGRAFMGENRSVENELLILNESWDLRLAVAERLMSAPPEEVQDFTIFDQSRTGLRTALRDLVRGAPEPRPITREFLAARVSRYATFSSAGRQSDGMYINVVSNNPREAAFIANAFAEEYVLLTRDKSRESFSASRSFLESQLVDQERVLQLREDSVRRFMTEQRAVNLDTEASFLVTQVSTLEAQRDEANILIQMRQAQLQTTEQEVERILPNLARRIASGVEQDMELVATQIAEAQGRLETIYIRTPALREPGATIPPEVRQLQTQIALGRERMQELADQLVEGAVASNGVEASASGVARVAELQRQLVDNRIELSALQARREVLNSRLREYERSMAMLPAQVIGLAQAQRNRQVSERLVVGLTEKLNEARVAEQSEIGYAQRVRPAFAPPAPFGPRRPLFLLGGFMGALLLGLGISYLLVTLDHRLHRPDDITNKGYTVLATIPDLKPIIQKDFGGAEMIMPPGGSQRVDTRLITLLNPISAASEAYKSLRTNLQFTRPDESLKTFLITSANPAEGKSTTAANLAIALAAAGNRTLLMDADLRKPTVHAKFSMKKDPGLVEMLFKGQDFHASQWETDIDNFYVLPSGKGVPNPAEILGSKAMQSLLNRVAHEFDYVIIDSPPVLVATDAVLLAAQADGVLVVVSAGETKDFALQQATDQLTRVKADLLGIVLNGFDATSTYGYRYKYRYNYQYNYRYGYSRAKDEN